MATSNSTESEIKEHRALVVDDATNTEQSKQESECMLWTGWTLWFIFGGGIIMAIVWCLVAIVATLLLIPAKSSISLVRMLPIVIAPQKVYADCKTITPSCFDKTARLPWILPFGLLLSINHLCLGLVFLPLLCCNISWSKYHFHAMAVVFNPYDKVIIDTRMEKFTWYSRSYEVVENVKGLENKVVIVTGCNTGLGKETAKQLYRKGCIVIMACRNPEKANNARNDIIQECDDKLNPDNLIFIRLDLGDLKTIDEFIAQYEQNEAINGKLDILICNAGVMAFPEFGTTKDGFERQFGINHMGHFYLFNKLLSVIKANKTRIVALSSVGHYMFHTAEDMTDWLNISDNGYKGPTDDAVEYAGGGYLYYGISKLSNLLFARQINKLYNKDGVYALAVHPGGINTELGRNTVPDCGVLGAMCGLRMIWEVIKSKDIPQGAATTLRCATITDEEIINGDDNGEQLLYFDDVMPRNDKIHGEFIHGQNTEIDESLWNYSCEAIKALDYLTLNED